MGQALSIKDSLKGEKTTAPPKTAAEEAATAAARAYVDNVTREVYTDPAKCVQGCSVLVGEDAQKAIKTGEAPKLASSNPPSPEVQTAAEIARREKAEADAKEAAEKAAADKDELDKAAAKIAADNAKAAGVKPTEDKARKQRPATKHK